MRFMIPTFALACMASMAVPLAAQAPDPPAPPPGHPGMMAMHHEMQHREMQHRASAAGVFLALTGELQLTDGQVTKLAAIARRTEERHKAMHASFDSLHARGGPPMRGDSAERNAHHGMMMGAFQKAHDAEHADLRDAIAVLNPDQLAKVWETMAARHHMGMHHGAMHGKDGPGGFGPPMHDGHGPDGDSAGRGQHPAE